LALKTVGFTALDSNDHIFDKSLLPNPTNVPLVGFPDGVWRRHL